MQIKRRRRPARGLIAIGAAIGTLCLWAGVGPTPAHAGVTQGIPAPYVTPANSSDPHTKPCVHNGQPGFCLFTSQDLRQGTLQYPGTNGTNGQTNFYPMSETFGYFSVDGVNWSAPTVLMRESTYQSPSLGWVQSSVNGAAFSPLHLWAPSAQQGGDGNWYLYVPDISDQSNPGGSSFIGVSEASDPMGPYTPVGQVNIPSNNNALNPSIPVNPNIPGYASDPDVVDTMSGRFGTAPYLAYADGDFGTCGGISIAPLSPDMRTLNTAPVHPLFDGIPSTWGAPSCTDVFGRTHLYMEGPHIYNTTLGGAAGNWPKGVPGPFLMVVPIKPNAVPPECATNGQPNTSNELIAYFTANSPTGDLHADNQYHWTYGGLLMCGSQADFTDQGSIMPATSLSGNRTPLILVYHDGLGTTSTGHQRTLHAECLMWDAADTSAGGSPGNIAQSIRTGGTLISQSGAEANCLGTNFDNASIALRSPTGMFVSGNGALTANRYGPGPWEKYQVQVGGKSGLVTMRSTFADFGNVQTTSAHILSEANNQYVSISGSCLNTNGSTIQLFDFIPNYSGSGTGGILLRSELTNHGEMPDPGTTQVCDEGGTGSQWFVYHY